MNIPMKKSTFVYLIVAVFVTLLFSRNYTNSGIDYSWHYLMIEKLTRDLSLQTGFMENWGALLDHPAGSHFIAAVLGRVFDSSILGMHILGLIGLSTCWFVMSRLAIGAGFLAFSLFAFIILYMCNMQYGMIFGYELIHNYLFGQFIATSFLLLGLYLVFLSTKVNWRIYCVCSVLFYVGLLFHATFSIIFLASTCVYFLYQNILFGSGSLLAVKKWLPVIIYGMVGCAVFATHPYSSGADLMRTHNGALGFSGFASGSSIELPGVILLFVALFFSALGIWLSPKIKSENTHLSKVYGFVNCVLLGAVGIAIIQYLLMKISFVSPYIVKKNYFTIATFLALSLCILIEVFLMRFAPSIRKLSIKVAIQKEVFLLPLILLVVSVSKFSYSSLNYADIVDAQKIARHYHLIEANDKSYRNTGAFFPNVTFPINFMISLADLQAPRGEIAHAVLNNKFSLMPKGSFILTEALPNVPDTGLMTGRFRIYSAEEFHGFPKAANSKKYLFTNGGELTPKAGGYSRFLSDGFSAPEPWGTWSLGEASSIIFATERSIQKGIKLSLEASFFLPKGKEKLEISVFCNGQFLLKREVFSPDKTIWEISIPQSLKNSENEYTLDFKYVSASSPQEFGMSADTRKLAMGVSSFILSY